MSCLILGAGNAMAKSCQKDFLTVTVGAVAASENKKRLIKDKAEINWEFTAGATYGVGYSYWRKAKRTSVKCKKIDRLWFCTARARACSR